MSNGGILTEAKFTYVLMERSSELHPANGRRMVAVNIRLE